MLFGSLFGLYFSWIWYNTRPFGQILIKAIWLWPMTVSEFLVRALPWYSSLTFTALHSQPSIFSLSALSMLRTVEEKEHFRKQRLRLIKLTTWNIFHWIQKHSGHRYNDPHCPCGIVLGRRGSHVPEGWARLMGVPLTSIPYCSSKSETLSPVQGLDTLSSN